MAQLKDDCFAFGDALIPFQTALDDLSDRLTCVVETEAVSLRQARGRTLAQDIISTRNVPPLDNSAVDGYAVFSNDLASDGETRLPVTGRVAAGHPLGREAKRGEAVRIFTGAPMPKGMDTVFMEEDCQLDDDTVTLPQGLKAGSNRRFAGEDIKIDDVIVHAIFLNNYVNASTKISSNRTKPRQGEKILRKISSQYASASSASALPFESAV